MHIHEIIDKLHNKTLKVTIMTEPAKPE